MRHIAAKYSDFPKLNAPAALMSAATQQLPIILFGILFSPAIVGFYAMAVRLTHMPITIVANSVRRVFLQKAAEIYNRGRGLGFAFLMSTGALALMGAIPLAVLWFFGQPLTSWVLGDKWSGAGRFLEIISPWLFMLWVTAPSNPVFVVLRKQHLWLSIQIMATVFRLGTFGLSYLLGAGPEWTLGAFVIATVIGNMIIILTAWLLVRQQQASLTKKVT
jgi:O-antigen/teichoic acid export membrane protein